MKLAQLDQFPGYSSGLGPLGLCLQWLDTLTRSPAINWNPEQLAQARQNLDDAHTLLLSDVLTLAGRTDRAAILRRIDEVEAETAAHIRAQEAREAVNVVAPGADLRNVAQAVAGAVPPGTVVRLSLGDGYEPPAKFPKALADLAHTPESLEALADLAHTPESLEALADLAHTPESLEADNPHNAWLR